MEDQIKELGERIQPLVESIKEMNELIESRNKLSSQVFNEAEKVKIEINNFLSNPDVDDEDAGKERTALRQKLVELAEFQLKEKINCWQDIAKIKQELREKEQELAEKKSRFDILKGLMEE